MERVAAPAGVTFVADTVGGISGWWAKPARPRKGAAIIHVHGGWGSEGGRGGKEGRFRWAADHLKKKKLKAVVRDGVRLRDIHFSRHHPIEAVRIPDFR